MKYFACILSALWLIGCVSIGSNKLYEVKMLNGGMLYAESKPVLHDNGYYHFQDINKQSYRIKKELVLYVEPVSFKR